VASYEENGGQLATDLESHEAANDDILSQQSITLLNQLIDCDRRILNEGLVQQANFFIELV
jgi:hypothetical protein